MQWCSGAAVQWSNRWWMGRNYKHPESMTASPITGNLAGTLSTDHFRTERRQNTGDTGKLTAGPNTQYQWCSGAVVKWCTVVKWCSGEVMQQCCSGAAVLQWCSGGAVVQ